MRLGIDTWSGYGPINWAAVENAGISFAWMRATGAVGSGGVDAECKRSVENVRRTSIAAGPYHVFHHGQDATKSAEACFALADGLGSALGDLPPALDAEIPGIDTVRPIAATVVASLERHVDAFHKRFSCLPILYGYRPWFEALGESFVQSATIRELAAERLLWIAAYPYVIPHVATERDSLPKLPAPFTDALVHQYSAEHSVPVPGVGPQWCTKHPKGTCQLVDRNRWTGTEEDFRRVRGLAAGAIEEVSGGTVHPKVFLGRPSLDEG